MKTIAFVGANGKMGRLLVPKLQSEFYVSRVDVCDNIFALENVDLVIDFASARSSVLSAKFCKARGIPLLVGSTGQTEGERREIEETAKFVPVMIVENFSLGIVFLKRIIKLLMNSHSFDISIVERHHKDKKDSPSGTALMLKKTIEDFGGECAEIASVRGGKEVGTHEVDFYFGDELLRIEHKAFSREAFAVGAIKAAEFLVEQKVPKIYNYDDII